MNSIVFYLIITLSIVIYLWLKKRDKESIIIFLLCAFCIMTTLVFLEITAKKYEISNGEGELDMNATGQVGDFIGGIVGTIVAGISIVLLYKTFVEQRAFSRSQTVYLQKNEIAQKNQQFETTFFQLLNTHNNLKQAILFNTKNRLTWWEDEKDEPNRIVNGLEFLEFAKWDLYRLYQPKGQIYPSIIIKQDDIIETLLPNRPMEYGPDQPLERIKSKYKKFFDTYHSYLGHYFRNVYYILKYINKQFEIDVEQEGVDKKKVLKKYKFYVGTLQSQMSSSELFLLFYNGICFPKMKKMIIKYHMLENLAKEDLADSERHYNLYEGISLKTRTSIINDFIQ